MFKVFNERQVITARAKRPPPLIVRIILLNYSKLMIYFLLFLETCQEAQILFVYFQNNEYCLCWGPRRELLQARKPKTIKWKEIVLHCLCGCSFAVTIKLMFTTVKQ